MLLVILTYTTYLRSGHFIRPFMSIIKNMNALTTRFERKTCILRNNNIRYIGEVLAIALKQNLRMFSEHN